MNPQFETYLCLAALLAIPCQLAAAAAPKLPSEFDVKAVDAFLAGQVRAPEHVGLSVAIVKDGQVVLAKGYGKRSLADGRPVEPDTVFAIGSVTKQFICASALLRFSPGRRG